LHLAHAIHAGQLLYSLIACAKLFLLLSFSGAGTLSPSADVYAVGVLMWELFTAEKVFKQLSDSEVILAVVTKKARPTFPSDCPSK
jgi:hypothetical protein